MKFLVRTFIILFFGFFNVDFLKAVEINCSSPVHRNREICNGESGIEPKIDPKELIKKVTDQQIEEYFGGE